MSSDIAALTGEFCHTCLLNPHGRLVQKSPDMLPNSWFVSLHWRVISHQNGAGSAFYFTVTAQVETLNLLTEILWPTVNEYTSSM